MDKNETKQEKVIGEFKPKREFKGFLTATRTRVRLNTKEAYIDGSQLSGILDNTKFKITICNDKTINFEEIGTSLADKEMKVRLLESIDDMDITGYAEKFVISKLRFKNEEGLTLYLEVEHKKPFDELNDILSTNVAEISEKGKSILDDILGGVFSGIGENEEEVPEKEKNQGDFKNLLKNLNMVLKEKKR